MNVGGCALGNWNFHLTARNAVARSEIEGTMKLIMKTLPLLIAFGLSAGMASISAKEPAAEGKKILMKAEDQKPDKLGEVTLDSVMGGLSTGTLTKTEDGMMQFKGDLSLKNNGGFSMWTLDRDKRDLSDWLGMQLKVKGDGRAYNLRLTTDERFRGGSPVAFEQEFQTEEGKWTTVQVPFKELKAGWRGRDLETKFDPSKVESLSIILADKKEAPFKIIVEMVGLYK